MAVKITAVTLIEGKEVLKIFFASRLVFGENYVIFTE